MSPLVKNSLQWLGNCKDRGTNRTERGVEKTAEPPVEPHSETAHDQIEYRIKEVELALKQAELKGKARNTFTTSPLAVAIITGILGLIGAEVANILQTRANFELERQKAQSSLILKAIETGTPKPLQKIFFS